jgi:hypothetical protein
MHSHTPCEDRYRIDDKVPQERSYDLTLQSSILGDNYIHIFQDWQEWDDFFGEAIIGNTMHEVTVIAVIDAPQGETSYKVSWFKYNLVSLLNANAYIIKSATFLIHGLLLNRY